MIIFYNFSDIFLEKGRKSPNPLKVNILRRIGCWGNRCLFVGCLSMFRVASRGLPPPPPFETTPLAYACDMRGWDIPQGRPQNDLDEIYLQINFFRLGLKMLQLLIQPP